MTKTKEPKKAKAKAAKKPAKEEATAKITKSELFAEAYVRHLGNGTQAALEVFDVKDDSVAQKVASEYLRKPVVQKIVSEYVDERRKTFKKFVEQGEVYLTAVVTRLMKKLEEPDLSVADIEKLGVLIARFAGVELSEVVASAKITAREAARGRAVLPGIAAPGIQPGQPAVVNNDNRRAIFLLRPPPLPPGGKAPPALEEQWREMGWVPGVAEPPAPAQNASHAPENPRPASHK